MTFTPSFHDATLEGASSRAVGAGAEHAGWLGAAGERMFVFRHLPRDPTLGLVVCSPVGAEADTNYRREVLASRELAGRGIAVQRHHYLGFGNSDGDPQRLDFTSMVDDSMRAAQAFADLVDAPIAVLGTRLAAYVAGAVAEQRGSRAVAFWDPPSDGATYFRQLSRLLRVNRMAQSAGGDVGDERSLSAAIESDGVTEVGGYEIHQALFESMRGRRLAEFAPAAGTAVHLVQFGADSLSPQMRECATSWEHAGATVDSVAIPEQQLWWFAPDDMATGSVLTRATVDAASAFFPSIALVSGA